MSELLRKLADWRPFSALVVGDFMLDQLVYGDAERLTADAPVPVLQARRTEETPGGAASVCIDLAAMHGSVRALGVIGDDPEGRVLVEKLEEAGVTAALVTDATRPTTVKRSLIGLAQHRHPQKMFRVDYESREAIAGSALEEVLRRLEAALPDVDIVALEDYDKGVCTEPLCRAVIDRCRAAGVPVLVDPAAVRDYQKYHGCSAITPNRTEAELATGLSDERATGASRDATVLMAHDLQSRLDCDAVVLTLDKQGALLLERGREPERVPTVARQVYDVTGAGDMVLAALCAGRANGMCWTDAVRFANAAAGLEVEVFGVVPIPFERIHQSLITQTRRPNEKLRTLAEASIEAAAARREGRRLVFTNGCFDVIHAGHIALLRRAKAAGDLLIVGLNSDESVRRLKGPDRPVHPVHDRVEVLSELASVDLLLLFDDDTPMRLIEALRPDVLVKGADYTRDEVVGADLVESYGGRIELIELLPDRSTSATIDRMRTVERRV